MLTTLCNRLRKRNNQNSDTLFLSYATAPIYTPVLRILDLPPTLLSLASLPPEKVNITTIYPWISLNHCATTLPPKPRYL